MYTFYVEILKNEMRPCFGWQAEKIVYIFVNLDSSLSLSSCLIGQFELESWAKGSLTMCGLNDREWTVWFLFGWRAAPDALSCVKNTKFSISVFVFGDRESKFSYFPGKPPCQRNVLSSSYLTMHLSHHPLSSSMIKIFHSDGFV